MIMQIQTQRIIHQLAVLYPSCPAPPEQDLLTPHPSVFLHHCTLESFKEKLPHKDL